MRRQLLWAALSASVASSAGLAAEQAKTTNWLANGGFEKTIRIDGKRLADLVADGWRFPGQLLIPDGWQIRTPMVTDYFVPGFLEVVRNAADAPEGRHYLRLATPGGKRYLRTMICQQIRVPASKAFRWSYRVRGHFCLDEKAGMAILRRYLEVKNTNRPSNFLMFQYRTPDGQKTLHTPIAKSNTEWQHPSGTLVLTDCIGKTCTVSLATYGRGIVHAATSYFDDIRLTPAAEPAPAAGPTAPRAKPLTPVLSRRDYGLSPYWKPVAVCGKDFRYLFSENRCPVAEWLSRFPKLARVFQDCAMTTPYMYPSRKAFSPKAPFMIVAPRWDHGHYCDLAGSKYLQYQKVVSFRAKKTINGVKGYNLDGWKSADPLPQSILYDFYHDAYVASVRVYPAVEPGRKTHFRVEVAGQDRRFSPVGEHDGAPVEGGHPFAVARKLAYVRVSVLADSTGRAQIRETEFAGTDGAPVRPMIASATSEAEPLNPKGVPTWVELGRRLKKKHGERFLGFIIYEYLNGFNKNLLEAGRAKRNPLHAARETRVISFFPFRPMSPRNAEETYRNYCFGMDKIMHALGGNSPDRVDVTLLDGWSFFEHYTCELGSAMSCTEFASATWLKVRAKMMFSRSAARQYRKPWCVYHTTGFLAKQPTKHFKAKKAAGIYKGDANAQVSASPSYVFRAMVRPYMMGCNFLEWEEARWFGTYDKHYRTNLYPDLTDKARAFIRADTFIRNLPDRGTPYTPVAFSVDYMHGIAPNHGPWTHRDPDAWQEAGRAYLSYLETFKAILPARPARFRCRAPVWNKVEVDNLRMANSHCGNVFDVLIPNPPSGVVAQDMFDAFKAIVVLGRLRHSPELTQRFRKYVQAGGTLVLNVSQLGKDFDESLTGVTLQDGKPTRSREAHNERGQVIGVLPKGDHQDVRRVTLTDGAQPVIRDEHGKPLVVRHPVGKGWVLTCTVPEMLSVHLAPGESPGAKRRPRGRLVPAAKHLIERVHDEAIPFRIDGDIEFMLNRVPDGWLVTLINNRGIYKEVFGPVVREPEKTAAVQISPKDGVPVYAVEELMEGNVPLTKTAGDRIVSATVCVPPGDVRVAKFVTRPPKAGKGP